MGRARPGLACAVEFEVSLGPVPMRYLIGMPADKERKRDASENFSSGLFANKDERKKTRVSDCIWMRIIAITFRHLVH